MCVSTDEGSKEPKTEKSSFKKTMVATNTKFNAVTFGFSQEFGRFSRRTRHTARRRKFLKRTANRLARRRWFGPKKMATEWCWY